MVWRSSCEHFAEVHHGVDVASPRVRDDYHVAGCNWFSSFRSHESPNEDYSTTGGGGGGNRGGMKIRRASTC